MPASRKKRINRKRDSGATRRYVLGHSAQELERLGAQARLIEPFTHQLLCDAGILPGMRVLDVGCGAGDVTWLLAGLIGESGEVVGVDRNPNAIAVANAMTDARSLRNVSFRVGDPVEMTFERPFDAVVGRYVLWCQRDLPAALRKLASHLSKGGGVLVFHEPDWAWATSSPNAPLYETCCRWIIETFRRAGTDANMALKLHAAIVAAGMPAPSMRMQTLIGGGATITRFLEAQAELVVSLVPEMERLGIAKRGEVGTAETLAQRLVREIADRDSVIIGRSEIGAWTRV